MSARRLIVEWEDPMPDPGALKSMSGLEYVRGLKSGRVRAPITGLMGFWLVEVSEGFAAFECRPGEQHYNPVGAVHGGLACTLLDSAMGCAVHSTLAAGTVFTTLELKVNLVRPIHVSTGSLRCEGSVLHAGRRVATAQGRVIDADGKLYAHATTTCLVYEI